MAWTTGWRRLRAHSDDEFREAVDKANELLAAGDLFAKQIEPEPAEEGPPVWALAEGRGRRRHSTASVAILAQAILAQAISCSNVRMIFLRHELFWFCLVQVSTTQFCWCPLAFITRARLMMQSTQMCPIRHYKTFLQSAVLLMVLFPTSTSSMEEGFEAILAGKLSQNQASLGALASIPMLTVSCHSHNQRQPLQTRFQVLNRSLAVLQLASPHWKLVQPQLHAVLARQDLGPCFDRLTAPQPLGPMTQGHLKITGSQDADSINSQAQMMKMLEVPFSYVFLRTLPCRRVRMAQ